MTRLLRRLATWLVRVAAPARWRDSIAGDFEEASANGSALGAVMAAMAIVLRLRFEGPERPSDPAPAREQLFSALASDVRHAWRTLSAHRAYSAAAIIVLALGIGANVAVFSLGQQLINGPIPGVANEDRLVNVQFGMPDGSSTWFSVPAAQELGKMPALSSWAAYGENAVHMAIAGAAPKRMDVEVVTSAFFDVLGGRFTLGRGFTQEEGWNPAASPAIVISDRLWRQDLGGAGDVIGRQISIDGDSWTIVGVAPRGFHGPTRATSYDVWVPIGQLERLVRWYGPGLLTDRDSRVFSGVIGALAPGRTMADVQAQAEVVRARLASEQPKNRMLSRWRFMVQSGLRDKPYVQLRLTQSTQLLAGVVVLLLILASANVGNLMLARASARRAEIATRAALGASRARIARLLLVESACLACAAGTVAIGVAAVIGRLLAGTVVLSGVPALETPALDWRVLGTALGLSFVAALVGGWLPAMTGSRADVHAVLRESGRSQSSRGPWTRVLMSAQVAISLTMLAGALLLTRSMTARQSVDPGFDASRVAQFSIDPATQRYDVANTTELYTRLTRELRAIPGVRSAAQARWAPFSRNRTDGSFHSEPDGGATTDAEVCVVAGGYFAALGVPFVEGRDFTDAEVFRTGPMPSETPAIVTQSFARALFGGASAVGRRFYGAPAHTSTLAIVGVVRDFRHDRVTQPAEEMIFEASRVNANSQATFLVGTSEPFAADAIAARAREIVASIDPTLPIFGVRTLADAVAADLAADRLVTMLATVFAVLATLLAAVGLYGVIARGVAERRRELSIRVALGAAPSRIARLVASDAWRMGAFGVIAGLAATFWLSRYLESWLFDVAPRDPISLTGALMLIAAVLFGAAVGPARRATRIDNAAELK